MYVTVATIFWFIRQFFMPNPFAALGEGIAITILDSSVMLTPEVLNGIVGLFLFPITFFVVGLYYSRGACPVWGSILYMLFYCLHTCILYWMSLAYPFIFLALLILVVYIGLHIAINIFKNQFNQW